MNALLIFGVGFLGQTLYFSRTILQWFKSENEGEVISPVVFWQLSLIAAQVILLYGLLRNDFSILLGQSIVYFIYVRNLWFKKAWKKFHLVFRIFVLIYPFLIPVWILSSQHNTMASLFRNVDIPLWLLLLGTTGQLVFSFRFVYQWVRSEMEQSSVLPREFWIFSIAGSLIILVYSVYRLDPVLFLSNLIGLFVYTRNLMLHFGKSGLISGLDNRYVSSLLRKISDRIK